MAKVQYKSQYLSTTWQKFNTSWEHLSKNKVDEKRLLGLLFSTFYFVVYFFSFDFFLFWRLFFSFAIFFFNEVFFCSPVFYFFFISVFFLQSCNTLFSCIIFLVMSFYVSFFNMPFLQVLSWIAFSFCWLVLFSYAICFFQLKLSL